MTGRARRRDEGGFTGVEMIIAAALMVTMCLIGFAAEGAVARTSNQALDTSQETTAAALALSELRQEIVSGNVIFDPQYESGPAVCGSGFASGENCAGYGVPGPGFSLRVYTQNASTSLATPGNYTCVQWRVESGALQTRQWPQGTTPSSLPWSTLITGVVNSASNPPFTQGIDTFEDVLINVDLVMAQHSSDTPVAISEAIAARNASKFSPTSGYCSPVPSP